MSNILLIDDDPVMVTLLQRAFEAHDHRVTCIMDSRQAMDIAASSAYDLILLDLIMPELSGWDVLESLRKHPVVRSVPVMILSARGDVTDRVRGLRSGAVDYLVKPFDTEELIARAEAHIERQAAEFAGLRGSLVENPVPELLQNLEQNAKTGRLEIYDAKASGRIEVVGGMVHFAEYASFSGENAVLTMLDLHQGSFRFHPLPQLPENGGSPFRVQSVLLQFMWLKDELHKRQQYLPDLYATLIAKKPVPADPGELADLPLHRILQLVAKSNTLSLEDLLEYEVASPSALRVSVAWLCEVGVIEALEEPIEAEISEEELESLDAALRDFFQEVLFRGFSLENIEIAFGFLPRTWKRLQQFLAHLPGAWLKDDGRSRRKIRGQQQGTMTMVHESGTLRFHLEQFTPGEMLQLSSQSCVALVIWLFGDLTEAEWAALTDNAEKSVTDRTVLMLVAPEHLQDQLEDWLRTRPRWRWLDEQECTPSGLLYALTNVELD